MNTISKKLFQHTPILHFQGNLSNAGATLRATEVKPKLDRFIIANLGRPVPADWKIGKTNALKYKLKITVSSRTSERERENLPMFFGKKKTAIKVVRPKSEDYDVTFEIFCLNESLRSNIEQLDWDSFFIATNVGTRQSKGYGSFFPFESRVPTSLVGREIKIDKNTTYRVDSYFSPDIDSSTASWSDIMNRIADVYKCLRSGINENGVYFKSLMFAYAKSENEWWDKRTIKELKFKSKLDEDRKKHKDRSVPDPLAEQPTVDPQPVYPMFRDNLGLATIEFAWKERYGFSIIKKDVEGKIKRFKSPILFKPLFFDGKWYVFLLHREIPQAFREAIFDVDGLKFQTHNSFSMKSYLNYVFSIEDYRQYISKPILPDNCDSGTLNGSPKETQPNDSTTTIRATNIDNDLKQLKHNYITIK